MVDVAEDLDRAVVAQFPCLIKAYDQHGSGKRMVSVEASNESVDADGDIVLQSALLDAASGFVATGHLDIDHLSEFGSRLNIPDPSSYIVGRPVQVTAGPGRTTLVEGVISRSLDGSFDPVHKRYDEFWASLRRDPPVVWFASIYGWPKDLDDCSQKACPGGATRYVIKALDWRSLAFTRSPKNTSIKGAARVISAKSYMLELAKSFAFPMAAASSPPTLLWPESMTSAATPCPNCRVHEAPSLLGYRKHFEQCKGCEREQSDILAHALMHRHHMGRSSKRLGMSD
jgi:hypothetical protein